MSDKFRKLLAKIAEEPGRAGGWRLGNPDNTEIAANTLQFGVNGFSKSGDVYIYESTDDPDNVRICAMARYGEVSELTDGHGAAGVSDPFDALVAVAYDWYSRYAERDPFTEPSSLWAEEFVRLGYMKVETKKVYAPANPWMI